MAEEFNTPSAGEGTEPTAEVKTYTAEEMQAELNRVGAKEARKSENSILKKLGLTSMDELPTFLEKLAMKQDSTKTEPPTTPEQYSEMLNRLAALEVAYKQNADELTERKQIEYLKAAGIPEDQTDFYHFKIGKAIGEGDTFEDVAAKYIKDNPPQVKPPEFSIGGGKSSIASTKKDEILKAAKAAMGMKG